MWKYLYCVSEDRKMKNTIVLGGNSAESPVTTMWREQISGGWSPAGFCRENKGSENTHSYIPGIRVSAKKSVD